MCLLDVFRLCDAIILYYIILYYTQFRVAAANLKWFFQSGSPCVRRDFSVVPYCLRLAQSVLTVRHTGKPLLVCFRHAVKQQFG